MCNSVFGGWCWVILGHKFGGGGLAGVREVLGGSTHSKRYWEGAHCKRYWGRYDARYATSVPIVPYSSDPLQGSGPIPV